MKKLLIVAAILLAITACVYCTVHRCGYIDHPSPNWNDRAATVDTIVLHYTAGGFESSLATLTSTNGSHRVSSHYLVDRDGAIYHLVDEKKRAWHAGAGTWHGNDDLNSRSVGIEIVNLGHRPDGSLEPYPEPQIDAVIKLCRDIMSRREIRYVVGHSDIGLGRKIDPGEIFPWKRLADNGIGVWTDDFEDSNLSVGKMLSAIGYDTADTNLAFKAFTRHFYPEALLAGGTNVVQRLAAVYRLITEAESRKAK